MRLVVNRLRICQKRKALINQTPLSESIARNLRSQSHVICLTLTDAARVSIGWFLLKQETQYKLSRDVNRACSVAFQITDMTFRIKLDRHFSN